MTTFDDQTIRRRPDGSIDTDHYVAIAARLRSTAHREEPKRWLASMRRALSGNLRRPAKPLRP